MLERRLIRTQINFNACHEGSEWGGDGGGGKFKMMVKLALHWVKLWSCEVFCVGGSSFLRNIQIIFAYHTNKLYRKVFQ